MSHEDTPVDWARSDIEFARIHYTAEGSSGTFQTPNEPESIAWGIQHYEEHIGMPIEVTYVDFRTQTILNSPWGQAGQYTDERWTPHPDDDPATPERHR